MKLRVVFAFLLIGCIAVVAGYIGALPSAASSRNDVSPYLAFQGSIGTEGKSKGKTRPGRKNAGWKNVYDLGDAFSSNVSLLTSSHGEVVFSKTFLPDMSVKGTSAKATASTGPVVADALDLYPAPSPAPKSEGCWKVTDTTLLLTSMTNGVSIITDPDNTIFIVTRFGKCPSNYP